MRPIPSIPASLGRDLLADLATCLRFFSRIPLPAFGCEHATTMRSIAQAARMLPVAGLVIGLCGAVPLILAVQAGLPGALAVVLYGCGLVLATGGLHEDGLADTADGLGGGTTRERKLAIMRDSRIGTYGVLAVGLALLLRFAAMGAILDRSGLAAAVAATLASAALSRALALLPLATLSPARADGLGRSVGQPDASSLAACFTIAALLGLVLPVPAGLPLSHTGTGCLAAAAAGLMVTWLAYRHIGGHTGDIGGASQQASEIAYLIGLLAFPTHA